VLAYAYFEKEPGRRAAAKLLAMGRGAADCRQRRQAAGGGARPLSVNSSHFFIFRQDRQRQAC